eukprot:CAMPEP_0179429466 /NCGR_PEP_ID=MMETSP0799-20121207/14830_1 /TAXON_ID=46947 /ORGANISM="Geminigera cryophila, Strain CCMP2564" /LENGTH=123 /DNA_ID=CAMNT_0021205373 /DNA_START=116 /DNA_END=487 /DNA_ORIENTATION=-
MGGDEGGVAGGAKAKKFDSSFKKAVGGSLKLKGVEFKGKKAIVTKKESKDGVALCTNPNAQFRASSHTLTKGGKDAIDMYQAPGGVKKISNSIVSGRSVGAMSYDPQANLDQRIKQKSDRLCM